MRRPLLLPLVPLYAAGMWIKRRFAAEPKRLRWPVVSVGSLSAGGAGKTPVVAALADLLGRHGYAVDVLSRGYGRRSDTVEWVDPEGTAERFGDEPLVLARAGLLVWVGAERYAAGLLAEVQEEAASRNRDLEQDAVGMSLRVHLLDDGFQHRRLARVLDAVLLTREDVSDWLLPAGNLRESLGRLSEAGAVVLREEEASELREVVARLQIEVPVWLVRRRLALSVGTERIVAFCGIARPEGFFGMLPVAPVGKVAFPDHHAYTEQDVERLMRVAQETEADGFVTTQKDAIKLTASMLGRLGKVRIAELHVEFVDEAAVMGQLVALLGRAV